MPPACGTRPTATIEALQAGLRCGPLPTAADPATSTIIGTTPIWSAEVVIDPGLAADLIAARFPELSPVSARLIGAGWDNTACLVNESLIFRFPRRAIAAPLIETEIQLLSWLAARVPIRIQAVAGQNLRPGEPQKHSEHRVVNSLCASVSLCLCGSWKRQVCRRGPARLRRNARALAIEGDQ